MSFAVMAVLVVHYHEFTLTFETHQLPIKSWSIPDDHHTSRREKLQVSETSVLLLTAATSG